MSDNKIDVRVGAVAGAGAGAVAGIVNGTNQAAKILKPYLDKQGKPSVDTYVRSRVKANRENIENIYSRHTGKIKKALVKVIKKAKEDFKPAFESATQKAKSVKLKSLATFAIAGAAIGTGIAIIANKIKESKAEKVQEAE